MPTAPKRLPRSVGEVLTAGAELSTLAGAVAGAVASGLRKVSRPRRENRRAFHDALWRAASLELDARAHLAPRLGKPRRRKRKLEVLAK